MARKGELDYYWTIGVRSVSGWRAHFILTSCNKSKWKTTQCRQDCQKLRSFKGEDIGHPNRQGTMTRWCTCWEQRVYGMDGERRQLETSAMTIWSVVESRVVRVKNIPYFYKYTFDYMLTNSFFLLQLPSNIKCSQGRYLFFSFMGLP